jgi:hypothetical protein
LDIVVIAQANGVRIGREQYIVVAVEARFTERHISGGTTRAAVFPGADATNPVIGEPRSFLHRSAVLSGQRNPELALFVGRGVRGDVYSIP